MCRYDEGEGGGVGGWMGTSKTRERGSIQSEGGVRSRLRRCFLVETH